MPYIKKEQRERARSRPSGVGELNYAINMLLIEYTAKAGLCYATINDISGAMTEAMAEFRRRVVVPYEDRKIQENGDLPWPQ